MRVFRFSATFLWSICSIRWEKSCSCTVVSTRTSELIPRVAARMRGRWECTAPAGIRVPCDSCLWCYAWAQSLVFISKLEDGIEKEEERRMRKGGGWVGRDGCQFATGWTRWTKTRGKPGRGSSFPAGSVGVGGGGLNLPYTGAVGEVRLSPTAPRTCWSFLNRLDSEFIRSYSPDNLRHFFRLFCCANGFMGGGGSETHYGTIIATERRVSVFWSIIPV